MCVCVCVCLCVCKILYANITVFVHQVCSHTAYLHTNVEHRQSTREHSNQLMQYSSIQHTTCILHQCAGVSMEVDSVVQGFGFWYDVPVLKKGRGGGMDGVNVWEDTFTVPKYEYSTCMYIII